MFKLIREQVAILLQAHFTINTFVVKQQQQTQTENNNVFL